MEEIQVANFPDQCFSQKKLGFLPHDPRFLYNLTPHRHFNSHEAFVKAEKFWSKRNIGQLLCHKIDVFADELNDEDTYVYAIQFCPIKVISIIQFDVRK